MKQWTEKSPTCYLYIGVLLVGGLIAKTAENKNIIPDRDTKTVTLLKECDTDEILRIDLDGDGDPDILERWWNGKRVRWFDENDDMTSDAVWGDMVFDALQVDFDGDGSYDGPRDYNVKWADTDGDRIPDVQVFNSNPVSDTDVFANTGVYYVTIDPNNTGLLMDIDWNDLSYTWTRYQKGPNWNCNYHGNATFLKEHAPVWAVENPEYSWENPFLFYDPDGDGCSEISVRVADDRRFMDAAKTRLRYDGTVDEAWVSYDLDNDTGRDNEMDYDMTLYAGGKPGLDYHDDIHDYPALKAPDWVLPYYRHPQWRQQTRFIYIGRDNAVTRLFSATWQKAYLTVDEDDDSHRWERVELYYPGDPYNLKRRDNNSLIFHPQSDSLGDRGEWDTDFSGKAKLYRAAWDGKIHLYGAERGAWLVDRDRTYWGGAHPNGVSSTKVAQKVEEVIQYEDTDGNGYLDRIVFDYDGNGQADRTDSLIELGIDDRGERIDVTRMSYDELRQENAEAIRKTWSQAQQLYRLAFRYGLADQEAHRLSKASSIAEKQDKDFWLKETILRKLLAESKPETHSRILKAYYSGDMQGTIAACLDSSVPSVAVPEIAWGGGKVAPLKTLCKNATELFTLSDNDRPGAWCWFQDERAVIDDRDPENPLLITGAIVYGPEGSESRGDVDLYWMYLGDFLKKGQINRGRFELEDRMEMDDHGAPVFWIRPDGRYLVTWTTHAGDGKMRYRISSRPGDPTAWSDTLIFRDSARGAVCYTNPRFLSGANEGRGLLFNGIRSRGFDSNYLLSDDNGETWRYGGRVLDASDPWPNMGDGGRAYVKYAGDGRSRVYIFSTDDHPQVDFNDERTAPGPNLNSIYAGYIENNGLYRTDGTRVNGNLSDGPSAPPTQLTVLLRDGTVINGDAMRRGWICDINTDAQGLPVGIFQFRANDNKDDHRYFYARFDGMQWLVSMLAYGGGHFGSDGQPDYTGLATVDPSNPDTVFISTSAHPVTGEPLISTVTGKRQHEIYMGKSQDGGKRWTWGAVTKNSASDNIRPIVPQWKDGQSLVLWMQGRYPRFYEYETKIVGKIFMH